MVVFISGHLDLTLGEFQKHYFSRISQAIQEGATFVVGDAKGTDTLAQKTIRIMAGSVTVYHMFDSPRNNEGPFPLIGGFTTDAERDAAMTAASDKDIAWVRPGRENSGTAKNLARRASQ